MAFALGPHALHRALLDLHNRMLTPKQRQRGRVDVALAIARAKVEDAENLEEANQFMTLREVFALIGDKITLKAFLERCGTLHEFKG